MKRVLIFIVSVLFAVVSYGQNLTVDGIAGSYDFKFDVKKNITYSFFYGSETADTLIKSQTWNRDYVIDNLFDAVKHEWRVALDSISGTPVATVTLEGKFTTADTYATLATATWHGTSADTVIALANSTAKNYRILNLKVVTS